MCDHTDNLPPKPPELGGTTPVQADPTRTTAATGSAAKPNTKASVRDARLKAALKANMARRKGQARARAGAGADPQHNDHNE